MADLSLAVSETTVAESYADFLDGMVIDYRDRSLSQTIESLGMSVETADIVMRTNRQKRSVARKALSFAEALGRTPDA